MIKFITTILCTLALWPSTAPGQADPAARNRSAFHAHFQNHPGGTAAGVYRLRVPRDVYRRPARDRKAYKDTLPTGTVVHVVSIRGGWYQISNQEWIEIPKK